MSRIRSCALLGALLLAACESDPVAPLADASSFLAEVTGSVEATFTGRGYFRLFTPPPGLPRPATFTLFSAESSPGTREVHTFTLSRFGAELPEPGRYPLSESGAFGSLPTGFQASYHRADSRGQEQYFATAGEVEVTHAAPDRIEGTFRMVARRACTGARGQMVCSFSPGAHDPDAPTVEVSGSFAAVPTLDRGPLIPGR